MAAAWVTTHTRPQLTAPPPGSCLSPQREVEHALALFDKVVDCWYKYLLGTGDEGMGMSEAQLQEARGMLQFVADRREKFLGERHIATGEVQYTLALLLIGMNSEHETSLSYVKNALSIYKEQLVSGAA